MLQNPRKTLGFKKNMVYKIPPGGGGKPYPASGLKGKNIYPAGLNARGEMVLHATDLLRRQHWTMYITPFSWTNMYDSISYHHIIIRFSINMQMQGHHPHQWAPFQVTG